MLGKHSYQDIFPVVLFKILNVHLCMLLWRDQLKRSPFSPSSTCPGDQTSTSQAWPEAPLPSPSLFVLSQSLPEHPNFSLEPLAP